MIKQISGREALERLKDKRHMGGDLFYFCYFFSSHHGSTSHLHRRSSDLHEHVVRREKYCSTRKTSTSISTGTTTLTHTDIKQTCLNTVAHWRAHMMRSKDTELYT